MEQTQESFLHRHRLAIALTLVLLISGLIGITSAVRTMKSSSSGSVTLKSKQALCVEPNTLPHGVLQTQWREYPGRQSLNGLFLPDLDLHEAEAYVVQQCISASQIVQSVSIAQTDKEKAKLYDQGTKLLQESTAVLSQTTQIIYSDATACVDALGTAMDADVDHANALTAKAKAYASAGNWGYCSHFSTEASVDLKTQNKCDNAFAKASKIVDPQNSFLIAAITYRNQGDWVSCEFFSDRAVADTRAMLSCQEKYAQAQAMSLQLSMPLQIITDAEVSLLSADWASCSFYGEQAIATLAPYMPTATPPP